MCFHPQDGYQYVGTYRRCTSSLGFLLYDTTITPHVKNPGIPRSFSLSRPKELRQLIRHLNIHLGNIKVIEVLRAANSLSLGQHLLDERRELDRADGIVVEYLVRIECV